jgi:hypothetical protein
VSPLPEHDANLRGRIGEMTTTRDRHLYLAQALLDWNRRHLRHDVTLNEPDIAERFAPRFVVEANGRRYEATHGNYLAFLDGFKRSIDAIDYDVRHAVADDAAVVLAMGARVTRVGGEVERFEAMLLLRFDEHEKVSLWHEIYVQQTASG